VADGYPQVTVASREQWRSWLAAHHASAPGVWVTTYKKHSGRPHVPVDDLVAEALAHGWIDSRPRSVDGDRSQRLVTRAGAPAPGRASIGNAPSGSSPPAA
jgi:uncharacterized protein YdeI (YjbR/CyaY-like superfamily)